MDVVWCFQKASGGNFSHERSFTRIEDGHRQTPFCHNAPPLPQGLPAVIIEIYISIYFWANFFIGERLKYSLPQVVENCKGWYTQTGQILS